MPFDTTDMETFRGEIRAWLATNCPAGMRDGDMTQDSICWGGKNWVFESEDQKTWLTVCAANGLTCPTWPVEYGGGGFTRDQEKIWLEELENIDARMPLLSFGIWMLGPALLHFGSHEQKLHYLPSICRGEVRWCQGYSEPGAGSDLASVQSKGEDKGDHWIVNGQKVWTSYADQADWIFALIRTDGEAAKHKGISFLLFDMHGGGVTTRPIKLISGASPFCETFFDDVKVPKEQIVGTENKGWDVAKYLLTHEREMISSSGSSRGAGRGLGKVLSDAGNGEMDASLRAEAMACDIEEMAVELTIERYKDQAAGGQGVGDASAMLKYAGTELNKRKHELFMSAGGSTALAWDGDTGSLPADWLRTKANSIEGGTSEVMLSIISKRVLGLPG